MTRIFFTCPAELHGVIAEPVPAKTVLPSWFKKLPPDNGTLTIKRCLPFLDAMTTGWIIPLSMHVELEVEDGGRTIRASKNVTQHFPSQIDGHHQLPRAPAKWLNPWKLRTPPGWSTLFVQPLNRESMFECMAGIVDTDRLISKPVNFPFFWTAPDGHYELQAGTPLVQAIPFQREPLDAEIRAETREEERAANTQQQLFEWAGAYRDHVRAPRKWRYGHD